MRKDIDRTDWNALSDDQQTEFGRELARHLPMSCEFLGIERQSLGDQVNRVARFKCGDAIFVFVPGDTVTLGWGESCPLVLDDRLEPHGGPLEEVLERIRSTTTPVRTNTTTTTMSAEQKDEAGFPSPSASESSPPCALAARA